MSNEDEPKFTKVDMFGQTVRVLEEDAPALIASRDESKKRATEAASAEAQRVADADKAKEEAEAAETLRLANEAAAKGDIDQLKSLQASELNKRDATIKEYQIQGVLAKGDAIAPSAVADVTAALVSDPTITIEGNPPIVKKTDGTSTTLDEYMKQWLVSHPHFAKVVKIPSSGADGSPDIDPNIPVITRAEYNNNTSKYGKQLAEGKLLIKD